MKNFFSGYLIALAFIFVGCDKSTVVIDGQFFGENDKTVFLEKLNPRGGTIVDSTKTDQKGNFTFRINEKIEVPTFYNIKLGNSYVPLLVEEGEDIEVSSMANIFYNYTVEGSKGSVLIKEFNTLVRNTSLKMDSLANLYEQSIDAERTRELGVEYEKSYIGFKRDAIKFITKNCNSLASLLPLYKPYNVDGQYLFDQPSDYLYFVMLSDSLSNKYPTSEYVISLKNDIDMIIARQDNQAKMDSLVNSSANNAQGYVDINMVDAKGKNQKLSDYKGKTILLSFTASEPVELKTLNNELKTIYNKYKNRGLVIYQVSLDGNKAQWLNTVSSQALPWISVCDFGGANSVAVRSYNINKVPTNVVINKHGDIVTTDIAQSQLEEFLETII